MKKCMIATEKNTFMCLSVFIKHTEKTLRGVFGKTLQPLCVQRRTWKHNLTHTNVCQTHIHVFFMCLKFLLCIYYLKILKFLQCIVVLHCNGTADAQQRYCTSAWKYI